jgi:hypothetical protein
MKLFIPVQRHLFFDQSLAWVNILSLAYHQYFLEDGGDSTGKLAWRMGYSVLVTPRVNIPRSRNLDVDFRTPQLKQELAD